MTEPPLTTLPGTIHITAPATPTMPQITYIDPDGGTWYLFDTVGGIVDPVTKKNSHTDAMGRGSTGQLMELGYVCSAIAGIEGMPVMMQTVPLLDGTALPSVYIPQTGTIGLAIMVGRPRGGNQNDYYDLLDNVVRAFYNRRNENPAPGILQITRPNGKTRQIYVYTTSGFNTPDVGKTEYTVYSFSLSTPDPYWTDTIITEKDFSAPGADVGILPIDFTPTGKGILFNSPHTLGPSIMMNDGDSYAYPTWVITGPGQPTVSNLTSGRSWSLNFSLAVGQRVQVITTRGHQSVIDIGSKANLWSHLVITGPRDLWPLLSGKNNINTHMEGMAFGSQISMSFYNRWPRA